MESPLQFYIFFKIKLWYNIENNGEARYYENMKYDFDTIIERRGTNCIKYDKARAVNPDLPEDFIPLWIADMDFACAKPILDAARARLDHGILGYTALADPAYFSAVTGWRRRRYGWDADAGQIVFSPGIVSALYAAVEYLTDPGDGVIVMTPAYGPFLGAIQFHGRKPVFNRLINDRGYYTVDFDDLEQKATDKQNTLLFLCNPQNPTGRVFTQQELTRIGEICFANGVFVVSDEIHADLVRRGQRHIPFLKLFPNEKRALACTAPSKTFNIAGNGHSNLFIPDATIRTGWAERRYSLHLSPLSLACAQAAYESGEEWLEQLIDYLDESFAQMKALLDARLPKAVFRIPEGTYLGWVDLSAYESNEEALDRRVSEAGVFVQFGSDFVDNANCFARINTACPRSVLLEGLERMCGAILKG